MPVIKFEIAELERLLQKKVSREELAVTIPMLGADPDDVKGDTWAVEFFPDRPDLYTVEGIARALRAWYGVEPGLRKYATKPSGAHVTLGGAVADVRPHIAAAYVKNVTITQARLDALIDLQEDLHWGLGARRKRVAIGVHDAAAVRAPFTYTTVGPRERSFVPLAEKQSMDAETILTKHPKGVEYAHLLRGVTDYPIIIDANDEVVSMPPIINAARTTVSTSTKNIFIDVTGTDAWAVGRALNILVSSLADSGGVVETVEIRAGSQKRVTPDLAPEERDLSVARANSLLGTQLSGADIAHRLERMGFGARAAGDVVHVQVPPFRADILHEWDLIEDVAIGHGINEFSPLPLNSVTMGQELPESRVAELARQSLVGLSFLEAMSLTLSNPRDQFAKMQRAESGHVSVKNPVTEDHTMLRVSLLPGLLNILKKNAHRDLPQRIFEVGMVTHVDHDGKMTNERRVAGVIIQGRSNFSEVKGVVLALARDLAWGEAVAAKADDPAFVAGRCAAFSAGGHPKGIFGEVNPATLEAFGLSHPVTAFELHLAKGPGDHVRGAH